MSIIGHVDQCARYPIKGCAGVIEMSLMVSPKTGIFGDRHFVITSPIHSGPLKGTLKAITQRQFPEIARIKWPRGDGSPLLYSCMDQSQEESDPLSHWSDDIEEPVEFIMHDLDKRIAGFKVGGVVNVFFERILDLPIVVVATTTSPSGMRQVESKNLQKNMRLGFADSHPVLVTNALSLAALNGELMEVGALPIPMNRFRPNIVVSGIRPWDEDGWKIIQIGDAVLEFSKLCGRCTVTTVDQKKGEFDVAGEPLKTLSRLRPARGGPTFGAYFAVRQGGLIETGDEVHQHE